MKTKGTLKSIDVPFRSDKAVISFEVTANPEDIEKYKDMQLDIEFKKHREHRSLDANAFLWVCLGQMAEVLRSTSWEVYLYELGRYGKYTYIMVAPEALADLRTQWRETKVVGETQVIDKNTGEYRTMIDVLCYFGSSTYDSKEFSRLLDGVISDMKDMHMEVPPDEQTRAIIEQMEENEKRKNEQQKQGETR